jgi:hypothetical protein
MHAQSDSGGCGKVIVSGFINAEDNKAAEQNKQLQQIQPLLQDSSIIPRWELKALLF